MKHLLYTHSRVRSLLSASVAAIAAIVSRKLLPVLVRILPGPEHHRLIGCILVGVSLVAQAFMLVLLAELVDLCIALYELWAYMAGEFVAGGA